MPYTIGLLNSVPRLGIDRAAQHELVAIPGNVPSPRDLPPGCAFHPRCGYFAPGLCDREIPTLVKVPPKNSFRNRLFDAMFSVTVFDCMSKMPLSPAAP